MAGITDVAQNSRLRLGEVTDAVRENWFAYLMFVPTLVFLVLLIWVPFFRGVWMSFHVWPAFGPHKWVGLDNYQYILTWGAFYTSVKATVIYMLMTVIQLGLALGAALSARALRRSRAFVDGFFLVPYAMPPVVTGLIWYYILNPNTGPLFNYLVHYGILEQAIYWGTNGLQAISVLTLIGSWTFWQFVYLILVASLEGIPNEHYETAEIYGASRLQKFWRVTLPQLKGALLIAVSIRIIRNMVKVSQPLQITQGGPGYQTSILSILMYRFALSQRAYGFAFTVGVIIFVLTFGLVFVFIREFNRGEGEAA